MSEMEKQLIDKLVDLPEELRQRFADKIEGAAMALDMQQEKSA